VTRHSELASACSIRDVGDGARFDTRRDSALSIRSYAGSPVGERYERYLASPPAASIGAPPSGASVWPRIRVADSSVGSPLMWSIAARSAAVHSSRSSRECASRRRRAEGVRGHVRGPRLATTRGGKGSGGK